MSSTMGTLKVTTPTDCEIMITRVFNAPRRLVWDAMTKPNHLMRWLSGPPGWTMVACDGEARVGESYRWAWRGPDGDMSMGGVYREVVAPERIVRTEAFKSGCNCQAGEQVGTLILSEQGGGDGSGGGNGGGARTTLTLTLLYPSKEARDGAIAGGMEQGMAAGYDRLAELLAATLARSEARSAA